MRQNITLSDNCRERLPCDVLLLAFLLLDDPLLVVVGTASSILLLEVTCDTCRIEPRRVVPVVAAEPLPELVFSVINILICLERINTIAKWN